MTNSSILKRLYVTLKRTTVERNVKWTKERGEKCLMHMYGTHSGKAPQSAPLPGLSHEMKGCILLVGTESVEVSQRKAANCGMGCWVTGMVAYFMN